MKCRRCIYFNDFDHGHLKYLLESIELDTIFS